VNEMNWFAWMMVALAIMAGVVVVMTIVEFCLLLRDLELKLKRIRKAYPQKKGER